MKNRNLLKEIPSGKFHSAIFTTYSINLYYLEQQVLPLLGSKGIHYVSILADGAMLSSQLENFGYLSRQRNRNYAINGIHSNGAFHPKLIFLAGDDSVFLLIGSGNLSTSGHGKNLEVWNSVYINNKNDTKYGFVIQAWNYLKHLHADLGESAKNKLKSIEENSFMLSSKKAIESAIYDLDEQNQISFHANQPDDTLFSQLSEIIGNDIIERITIMCPFHDSKGKFIHELNKQYNPRKIDVLVQHNFGVYPSKMASQHNVSFYEWTDVIQEKQRQCYFHAKIIVLNGKDKNYLISGSANATIAAFGTLNIPAINQESFVIYQSTDKDFLDLLSINLGSKPVNIKTYESEYNTIPLELSKHKLNVFIKTAEKNFDTVNLIFQVKYPIKNGSIQLFDTNGSVQFEEMISLEPGNHFRQLAIPSGIAMLFVQISFQGKEASNKQFIIDLNAFESTNPSPRNRSLNHIRALIDSGNFSTLKIIEYLNTIYRQKEVNKGISGASLQEKCNEELLVEEDDDLIYLSYAEIQERAKLIDSQNKTQLYIEYKGVRLWESIFSYLKESREKELQNKIDEEETETISRSRGLENKVPNRKVSISKSNFERLKHKVTKFLDRYHEILRSKTIDPKSTQPSLIDLSMYLIMLEILLHLLGHKESIQDEEKDKYLLQLPHSINEYSWSDYLIQFIGMFTLWCSQSNGFKVVESADYRFKLEHYKTLALRTNLSALSVYNYVNNAYANDLQKKWLTLNLLNSNLVFNADNLNHTDTEAFITFIPKNVVENIGEAILEDEISRNLTELRNTKVKDSDYSAGDYLCHPEVGYAYIYKVIQSPINTFYKLFMPGFDWDEEINNYWNGHVYSIRDNRWLLSKKGLSKRKLNKNTSGGRTRQRKVKT